jgi:hypothetical protein
MTTPTPSVGDVARQALALGLSVVPPVEDGTKKPLGYRAGYLKDGTPYYKWKKFQKELPSESQMKTWYESENPCSGVVNGGGKVQRGAGAERRPKWATPLV